MLSSVFAVSSVFFAGSGKHVGRHRELFERNKDEEDFRELSVNSTEKKFFRVGKSGQWYDKLTRQQIQQIENDHSEVMEMFDYKRAGVQLV